MAEATRETSTAEYEAALDRLWFPLFPWHQQQRVGLKAHTDVIMVLGGSQSGKSTLGAGIVGRLIRREGPIYDRLKNPHRPLKVWVAPLTLEKWRSNWESRLLTDVFTGLGASYSQTPHPVITWRDEYGENQLWGKSQDQGFLAFESDTVDLIVLDEEPADSRLYGSCMQRFATTNGCLVLAFTPLLGMDWTYARLYEPVAKPEFQRGDRIWKSSPKGSTDGVTIIQMGMADNPAAVGAAQKLERDPVISEQEKRTRLYGEYGFVEGLVFPEFQNWKAYFLPSLPQRRPYSWVLTIDPNKRHAGLLSALDHEGNWYCVAEHFETGKPDPFHARAYLEMLARFHCPNAAVFADPGGSGAQSIINMAERGVFAAPVPKDAGSVKASIDVVKRMAWIDPGHWHPTENDEKGRRKLGAPRVYFLGTLWTSNWDGHTNDSRLVWELQRYRWQTNVPFKPVKADDDCTDCLRYLGLVRPFQPDEPDMTKARLRETLDDLSYREAMDSQVVMNKHAGPRYQRTRADVDFDFPNPEVDLT
jgi:phage terminase large subunit-like protein